MSAVKLPKISLPKIKLPPLIQKQLEKTSPKVLEQLKKVEGDLFKTGSASNLKLEKLGGSILERLKDPQSKLNLKFPNLKDFIEKNQSKLLENGGKLNLPSLLQRAKDFNPEFVKMIEQSLPATGTSQEAATAEAQPHATGLIDINDPGFTPASATANTPGGYDSSGIGAGVNVKPASLKDVLGELHGVHLSKLNQRALNHMVGNPPTMEKVNAALDKVTKDRDLQIRTLSVTRPGTLEHFRAQMRLRVDNAELKVLGGLKAKMEKMNPTTNPDQDWGIDGKHPTRAVLDKAIGDATAARDQQAAIMSVSRYATPEAYNAAKAKLDSLNANLNELTALKAKLYPEGKPNMGTGNEALDEILKNHPPSQIRPEEFDAGIVKAQAAVAAQQAQMAVTRYTPAGMAEAQAKLQHLKDNVQGLVDLKAKLYPTNTNTTKPLPTEKSADGLIHDGRIGPGHGEAFEPSGLTSTQEHLLVNLKHAGGTDAQIAQAYQFMMAQNAIPTAINTKADQMGTNTGKPDMGTNTGKPDMGTNTGKPDMGTTVRPGALTAAQQALIDKLKAAGGTAEQVAQATQALLAQNAATATTTTPTTTTTTPTTTTTSAPKDAGTANASKLDLNSLMTGLSESQQQDLKDMKAAGVDDKQLKMQQMQFKMQNMSELMTFITNMSKMQNEALKGIMQNLR